MDDYNWYPDFPFQTPNTMPKARNAKNKIEAITSVMYVDEDLDKIWQYIEESCDITHVLPFYNNGGEELLSMHIKQDEMIYYCNSPFSNYAITSLGRLWSFKFKKFIKAFYRPKSVIYYMNSPTTRNVKIEKLFNEAGWEYNHKEITMNLYSFELLIDDYNGKKL